MAGRFGSVITDLELPEDNRNYEGIYDYCNNCGVCIKNCPANAISLEEGKDHERCFAFYKKSMPKLNPVMLVVNVRLKCPRKSHTIKKKM